MASTDTYDAMLADALGTVSTPARVERPSPVRAAPAISTPRERPPPVVVPQGPRIEFDAMQRDLEDATIRSDVDALADRDTPGYLRERAEQHLRTLGEARVREACHV